MSTDTMCGISSLNSYCSLEFRTNEDNDVCLRGHSNLQEHEGVEASIH